MLNLVQQNRTRGMNKAHILWADDEIDLLKPYILFLEEKGYGVDTVNSGRDAIEKCRTSVYDILFLDEHMPGLSGLETLTEIASSHPDLPVVMITKSEDEGIMEKAIGKKIADYLIKPVNPNQILMTIKKRLEKEEIISESNTIHYREEFGRLSREMNECRRADEWVSIYKKLTFWEIEFSRSQHPLQELLAAQKSEANVRFGKFVTQNYENWLLDPESAPLLSHGLLQQRLLPELDKGEKIFFILIDNFRYDQWLAIKSLVSDLFTYTEDTCFSILPTATQYARNAIFSGLTPLQLSKRFPGLWVGEGEAEGKNLSEELLLRSLLERFNRKERYSYHKISTNAEGEKLVQNFASLERNELNVVVFNFIDMLSHARTESPMIRELAPDEPAYRSITRSWFRHSPLIGLLKKIAERRGRVLLTTDHGTIRVRHPQKVESEKSVNANLRYKVGRNLTYDPKRVFSITHPEKAGLPSPNISTRYIFALGDDFFVYPNRFNHYVSYYENTFQHGGVSMEEMIVPLVTLQAR
ncbi:putative transcriptional regulatory protein YkoG [Petrimonas mucosa]|uniref:Putative transcriptional regulatory protein YkoG n=3 Tax=Dysgonomonadaceae TaxID=2005520 RepID=A0A1G4GB40_9BACT|nr:putative transcriptional regulatory protein YkoG [Petrimonas mucosa]SFU42251.1 Response regulator receiver domain-containing protein [Porphyromonadaceae bacterium KHP3R9]